MKPLTQIQLIVITAIFLVLFDNYSFFKNTLEIYPLQFNNISFLISLVFVLTALIILLVTLVSAKWTTKPVLIFILLVSSLTNYFMNSYHIIIDDSMIRNTLQTDLNESMDLLTLKQVLYFFFLGVLPSYLVYKTPVRYRSLKKELLAKTKTILISLVVIIGCILIFSKHYTSFFREHKPLRFSTNPTYWIYSIGNYINKTVNNGPIVVKALGTDAKVADTDKRHKKLVIMVVGEAARADHFSLNGYEKKTNPLLEKEDIINFSNMYSSGTSTAEAVPCMFSIFDRSSYNYKKGICNENVLDVLNHTKAVSILWRDNNSDSKGVALRVPYENYRTPEKNTVCSDGECRDIGMLVGLDKYIEENKDKDILIILHQMGNHGPAYYKRYPKEFEKFTPVCKTNQLEECTKEEISNAYDNAILYTDYFLSQVIDFLKKYDRSRKTAMIYMSDHGESLGENGIYLHGLPYFMAPDAQIHIGSLMWFGEKIKKEIDVKTIEQNKEKKYSQDYLFDSLLGLFNVKTEVYNQKRDIFNHHWVSLKKE
ncbi:phosphoethanolamine--lipid A transferase [Sulfurovum indicum]|uniref:Phosphoethanolamine--lipid A transferase n=1 Tax=Sulfurovum indicum TaxID=2779528 RepID=A0A7M1S7M8_9BACT|nr:phosphoethanolamine--lipid A transferase [Sulfurovum indicum]QOR62981.1 phosphoethanolamine--lipid A transferase [Sulfurovum indicum]